MAMIKLNINEFPGLSDLETGNKVELEMRGSVVESIKIGNSEEVIIKIEDVSAEQGVIGRFDKFLKSFERMKTRDGRLKTDPGYKPLGTT